MRFLVQTQARFVWAALLVRMHKLAQLRAQFVLQEPVRALSMHRQAIVLLVDLVFTLRREALFVPSAQVVHSQRQTKRHIVRHVLLALFLKATAALLALQEHLLHLDLRIVRFVRPGDKFLIVCFEFDFIFPKWKNMVWAFKQFLHFVSGGN